MAVMAAASSLILGGTVAAVAAPGAPSVATASAIRAAVPAATMSKVALGTIGSPVVRVGGSVTVAPKVTTSGSVDLRSKTITVVHGKKTIVRAKGSARLKAGTYTVSSVAKYRTISGAGASKKYSSTRTVSKKQKLVVRSAVYFKAIAGKTAPYRGKATIRPNVSRASGVHLSSSRLTVKLGTKKIATNRSSVALRAGTYRVTTTAKYRIPVYKKTKASTTGKTVTRKSWSPTYTATKTQTVKIKAGKKPNHVYGTGSYNCPAGYPIKGNASSMIYHVPRGAFYSRTNPEECFSSAAAARSHGYRASKR